MTDDARLSDFASTDGEGATTESSEGGDETADSDGAGPPGGPDSATGESATSGTTAATGEPETSEATATTGESATATTAGTGFSTYAWGEYTCSRCDAATDRVWRDDDGLVCPDCKAW